MNDDEHAEGAVLMVSTMDTLASNLFYSRWLQSSTNLFTNRSHSILSSRQTWTDLVFVVVDPFFKKVCFILCRKSVTSQRMAYLRDHAGT